MELRHLRYAVAVADAGTFTGAAHNCHVAQSALSKQIAQLEGELGTRLFNRGPRTVTLTDAGQVLVTAARQILADTAAVVIQVSDLAGQPTGHLRVGSTQTASQALDLAAVLGQFHREHPRVRVTVQAGPASELIEAIATGSLDLVLAARAPRPSQSAVAFRALCPPDPLVAVIAASHPLAGRDAVGLAELAEDSPFIEFRAGTQLRDRLDDAFGQIGRTRRIAFELGQIREMVQFAVAGLGTAVVPSVFTTHLTSGEAGVLTVDHPELSLTVGAHSRIHDRSPAVTAAIDLFGRRQKDGRGERAETSVTD